MPKKRVLILTTNPLHNAPRVIRETNSLIGTCDITAVGTTPPHLEEINFRHADTIAAPLTDKLIRKAYTVVTGKQYPYILSGIQKRLHTLIAEVNPDVIIAHNPVHFPYIFSYPGKKFRVIYNAHEYHPLEFDADEKWMKSWGVYFHRLYQQYLSKVDLMINVCDSIAKKCETEFGKASIVIPNAALYADMPGPVTVEKEVIRIIHHGAANPDRKIETMIDAVASLGSGYQLDLMLMKSPDEAYQNELETRVAKAGNARLIPPVAFNGIVPFISQYDIGLYNLPPLSFNNAVALPNKFFEFIQARLCIVTGPSVEMKKIVEEHQLGVVSKDHSPEAIAQAIKQLSFKEIQQYRLNAHKAASALSAEHYQKLFIQSFEQL